MILKEAREDLDIQVKNRNGIAFLLVLVFLLGGCSATREGSEQKSRDETKDIDYTSYDLTYVDGVKKRLEGDLAEAIYRFDEAIKINPDSDAAHYQISQVAAMRRDYENALRYGRRAILLDRTNPWYYMNMADIYMQLSEADSVAHYMEYVVDIDPDSEGVEFQLGNIYMQTGNTVKAENIFQKFYDKYGAGEEVMMALVTAMVMNEKYIEAKGIILKELEKSPDNIQLGGLLAEIYRKTGENEKAAEVYRNLLKKGDNSNTLDFSYLEFLLEEGRYSIFFENAKELISRDDAELEDKVNIILRMMQDSVLSGKYADSLILLGETMLSKEQDNPTVALLLAEIYSATERHEREIQVLIDFAEKNEKLYYVWERMLLKLNEMGETERLYKYSKKATELFNRIPLPKILYAYSLIEKGMTEKAQSELYKVRNLVNNEEQYLVQILSMEAEIAYREGDMDRASEKFDRALAIKGDDPLILNNYAYYLAEENTRLDEAEEMIKKCLDVEENITYLDTYAWILYKKGKFRGAEKVMRRIFDKGMIKDADLLEHYGYIKKARGDCSEAVKLWQAAIKEGRDRSYLIKEINGCVGER